MDKGNLPFSCKVRKKFLDPFDIGGVLFTIWEMTYKEKDKKSVMKTTLNGDGTFSAKKKDSSKNKQDTVLTVCDNCFFLLHPTQNRKIK